MRRTDCLDRFPMAGVGLTASIHRVFGFSVLHPHAGNDQHAACPGACTAVCEELRGDMMK